MLGVSRELLSARGPAAERVGGRDVVPTNRLFLTAVSHTTGPALEPAAELPDFWIVA